MKKKIITGILILLSINTFVNGSCIDKGKEFYDKELKEKCKMDSYNFAENHTQDEWKNIHDTGKMAEEITKICKVDIMLDNDTLFNLYNFVYEYASDGDGGGCGF